MTAGYCFFCDQPSATDPCRSCGKPLHQPEPVKPDRPEPRRDAVISDQSPEASRATPSWLKWAVGIAVLLVIAFLLQSPFGI